MTASAGLYVHLPYCRSRCGYCAFVVSADLILGLPGQSAHAFRGNVEGVCAAGVDHLSIYLLETEKSRAIEDDRRAHPERYLSDDEQADAWLEAGETLAARGFTHYEIS